MKFLDLFSGIGGFRLGLERAGHTPVGYVEIDKFARKSYQAMYDTTGEWTATDVNKVTDEEWRKFNGTVELIAGGFPCQSFSIAGKREGFLNKTKGTLFFEVARAVKQIQPRFVFLENVKGLLITTKETLSEQFSARLMNSGMMSNGVYLTAKTSEFHKIGNECILSDILEETVDEKYFLSSEKTEKLIQQM